MLVNAWPDKRKYGLVQYHEKLRMQSFIQRQKQVTHKYTHQTMMMPYVEYSKRDQKDYDRAESSR